MFDFLENEMPLYHWIEQPFVGLERTEDPSQTKEEVFRTTEIMPQFPGGAAELLKYIRDNMRYPQAALENNIQGRVIVQFVVGKDGNVTNVQVLKGVDRLCDQEAVRVIESMPRWIPGKHNGQAVRVYYRVPVSFFKEQ